MRRVAPEREGCVTETSSAVENFVAERFAALREAVGGVVIGQHDALRQIFITLLVGGHSLVEGVPGVAKTLLVRTLASALELRFGRIQFTPDLMPSDILGTSIFEQATGDFRFREGPIFTELLLADEINRAPAKTQSALLEAMQESTVTIDAERHELSAFFSVFATQNPVEQEGTYPLPEAELDRFLFKILVDYPSEAEEQALLRCHHAAQTTLASVPVVLRPAEIETAREIVRAVTVSDGIFAYVAELVRATRTDFQYGLGASPRAGLLLLRAAKAQAVLDGRGFVLPEDIQEMWAPSLRHRVMLDPALEVEGQTADAALERTLRGVTVPR
jgi:MoxR-like ATPase